MEEEYVTIDLQEIFNLLMKKIVWVVLTAAVCGIVPDVSGIGGQRAADHYGRNVFIMIYGRHCDRLWC